jgi:putative transposase
MHLYRAVNKEDNTIDFMLTGKRNNFAAHKFMIKAISNNSSPNVINIDQRGASEKAVKHITKGAIRTTG